MKLTRKQVELLWKAVQDSGVEEVELSHDSGGKFRVHVIEMVEKRKPLPLGK